MFPMKCFFLFIVICISSSSAISINCQFTYINWEIVGRQYNCDVNQIDISGNDTALLEVTGTHQTSNTNADVGNLIFSGNYPLDRLPTNIESFFPNLVMIYFIGGNLAYVSAENLQPFQNLRVFFAFQNQIATIDGDLFKYSPNLQRIVLDGNLITNVGEDLLTGLTQLTYANFQNNPCINILADTPEGIESLKTALQLQCPPLATTTVPPTTTSTTPLTTTSDPPTTTISTTTPNNCYIRCTVNEETDELRRQVDALADANAKFEERFLEQENRIDELERLIRELCLNTSLPCSSI